MNAYALVILAFLAFVEKIEARPEDGTTLASEEDKKADEVEEKKDDLLKSGGLHIVASPETTVEEISNKKSGESDPTDPKVKRAADEAPKQERTGDGSIEGATTSTTVDESKSGHDRNDSESSENIETPKIEEKEAIEEKSSAEIDENKSSDNVYEKTGEVESRENKNPPKDELKSATEVSTSTEALQQRSAFGSSSILETKGRLGESGESDNSEAFKGRAHANLRVPPVNPMAVINKVKDIGSRRMDHPNLMLNFPQQFPSSIQQINPQNTPPRFNSYLNAAPGSPNAAVAHASAHLAPDQRRYTDVFRPETNAYPYSPGSSQQADSLSKFHTLRDLPKLPTFPNNFYKPYDQNYGNFGARSRRYTVPSAPETINMPNKYPYTNFGYPHYIK